MTVTNQNNESCVHQMLDERVWLGNKVEDLRLFLGSSEAEELDEREASLLQQQFYYMESYLWVLQKRIRSAGLQTNN
jgi:hypothetical protein